LHNQPIRFGPPDNSTHTHTHTRKGEEEEEEETHQHHSQRRNVQDRCSPLHLSVKSKRESKTFWRRHIIFSFLSLSLSFSYSCGSNKHIGLNNNNNNNNKVKKRWANASGERGNSSPVKTPHIICKKLRREFLALLHRERDEE
jgi:hypothetical protein